MQQKPLVNDNQKQPKKEWNEKIRQIAHEWLLSDAPSDCLPSTIILPFENPDLHDRSAFLKPLSHVTEYRTFAAGMYRSQRLGVLKSKFGSPAVAMTVQVLARAGVKVIVGVGYCGGLKSAVKCGDLVVPLACIRDDGITPRFVAPGYPALADSELYELIARLADNSARPSHRGVVWSTDAVLLETTRDVDYWSQCGAIAVDMECGTLFTLSRLFGIRAASILVASDNPTDGLATIPKDLNVGMQMAINLAFLAAGETDFSPRATGEQEL